MRRAASLAIDRDGINKALTLGYSQADRQPSCRTRSTIYWQPPSRFTTRRRRRKLLAEAGYPEGLRRRRVSIAILVCESRRGDRQQSCARSASACICGRSSGRLSSKGYAEKKYKNLIKGGSGAFGNAATRLETFVVKGGTYVYGSYPDIDELFQQQAAELDHKKREAILHKMQQIVHERTMYAPIWQLAFINGIGPRVGESGFGLIPGFAYTAPYEDITLKQALASAGAAGADQRGRL